VTTKTPSQHGERRCYLRGCRRAECVEANKRYCKLSDLRRHREGPSRIDATDVASHLRRLIEEEGWTQIDIATCTGIKVGTIGGLAAGRYKTCSPENAKTILAFEPEFDAEKPGYWTSNIGSMRRLQALAVLGHPLYLVAEEAGISYATARHMCCQIRRVTSKDFAARIAAVYDKRRHQMGQSPVTRGMARAAGWWGPEAWRDIDDPQCTPEDHRDELGAYRRQEIAHLASFNVPEHEIADRLGMARAYVHDLIRDMGKAA
jgi:transcriptional regulator with XRE-family HTH domain